MWWWSTEKRKIICRQNIEYINSRKKDIKATLFSLQRISFLQLGSLYLSVLWYLDTNIALNYIDNQGGNQTFNVNYSYFMQPALALLIGSFDHRPDFLWSKIWLLHELYIVQWTNPCQRFPFLSKTMQLKRWWVHSWYIEFCDILHSSQISNLQIFANS